MNTPETLILPVVLTTEAPRFRRGIWWAYLVSAFITIIPAALPFVVRGQLDRMDMAGLLVFEAMFLACGVGLILALRWNRGMWIFDRSGITFEPLRGRTRHLRWDAVERVGLPYVSHSHKAVWKLRGDGITITLAWPMLPEDAAERGRTIIEKVLGKDFNLAIKPVPEEQPTFLRGGRWYERLIGLVKLTSFSVALNAVWMAVLFAILFGVRDRFLMQWLVLTWLMILILPAVLWSWRLHRRREQINPTWRRRWLD